jgi:hypothetical protein
MAVYPNYDDIPEKYRHLLDDDKKPKKELKLLKIPSVSSMKVSDLAMGLLFLNVGIIMVIGVISKYDMSIMEWFLLYFGIKLLGWGVNFLRRIFTHNYEIQRQRMEKVRKKIQKESKIRNKK